MIEKRRDLGVLPDDQLDLYLHLCPERILEFLRKNGVVAPEGVDSTSFKWVFILFGVELRLALYIKTHDGTTQQRVIQMFRDGKLVDSLVV